MGSNVDGDYYEASPRIVVRLVPALAALALLTVTGGKWTTAGPMLSARQYHRVVLLANGRVLATGGYDSNGDALANAELFDPRTGTWRATAPLKSARAIHTATLLSDGKVLVAGGVNGLNDPPANISDSERYDPVTETWSAAGTLDTALDTHTATLLPNGSVLIAAGYISATSVWLTTAELYNSAIGAITLVNSLKPSGGALQFAFTAAPNNPYTVWSAPDLAWPLSNWSAVGVVPEFSSGLFLFSDPQKSNGPHQFYRVAANASP